jgi:serine/threonine protein kinase/tetratricopeptide (TPR) repeat protein
VSGDRSRWRAIDAVFQEALDLDPDEWSDFLDRRCAADAQLRRAVEDLLAAERDAESFLEESVESIVPAEIAAAIGEQAPDPRSDRTGERVGAFRIVRQIGRGGMAGVYEAARADGEFEQRVAIKFLRRGLDTEDFVRRFLAERQILSSLEHPNIARLVDGGTTDRGLPYLALEYVEGVPITEHCDEAGCSVELRLRLFVQVARAVQHAHTNLVVHRDIKPSNILVTRDGQVKLLDFGIAKLLDPDAETSAVPLTRTGFRPLTPEYASPEQARGEPITTASDVYQLGVLLFRLLTGGRPYEISGTGATLEQTITNARPRAPSELVRQVADSATETRLGISPKRLSRRLRGDLDTIILKALAKEPGRRYATALEMADDVERHLDGRPITARRESSLYRTGKFLRRHAWVAPVSGAAALLVGAYVVTLIRHGRQLEEERNVARDVQRAFVSFFTAPDSDDVGLGEGRRDLTILQAIRDGTDRVRRELADRPAARAELFDAMAAVLQDLDETDRAYELATEALDIERSLYGSESPQVHETLLRVGRLTPDPDSARAVLEERLNLSRTLYGPNDPATAVSLHALAELDLREGRLEDAVRLLGSAIDIYRASAPPQPRLLAEALAELADNLEPLDRADDAVAAAREGFDILVRELGAQHSETATAGVRLAQALTGAGRYDEARLLYESSLAAMDTELGPTHGRTMSSRNNYAILLRLMGDFAGSEAVYRALLDALRERYGEVHSEVASSLQNLAVVVKDQGRYAEAERLSRSAYTMFEETKGPGYFQTAFPLLTISEIRLDLEDYAGAEIVSREALEILRAALPPGHFATSVAECRVGQALAGQGKKADARPFLESGAAALLAGDRREVDAYRDECLEALGAL